MRLLTSFVRFLFGSGSGLCAGGKNLCLAVLACLVLSAPVLAQDSTATDDPAAPTPPKDPLYLEFVKANSDHNPDSLYFNVLKVVNNTSSTVNGELVIFMADDWQALTPIRTNVSVAPGNTFYFPLRIRLPRDLKGGLTYLISGGLDREGERRVLANAYLNVPKISKWSATSFDKTLYFSARNPVVDYPVAITNRGNADELIRLDLEIGDRLFVQGPNQGSTVAFIEVPPATDTTVMFKISEAKVKNEENFTDSWTDYTLRMRASGSEREQNRDRSFHVWFRSLESYYTNPLLDQRSPLTINTMAQNVLADFQPTVNVQAFGSVLLPNKRDISYNIMHPNIAVFNEDQLSYPTYGEHLWRLSRMWVNYVQPGVRIRLGDTSDGLDQVIVGRGLRAQFRYDKHMIRASVLRNPILPIDGANATYNYNFNRNFSLGGGLTFQDDNYNLITSGTAAIESSVTFLKNHTVRVIGAFSTRTHEYTADDFPDADSANQLVDPDTSFTGTGYQIFYNAKVGRVQINARSRWGSTFHSGQFNGRSETNAQMLYRISKSTQLMTRYVANNFQPRFYRLGRLQQLNTRKTELLDVLGIQKLSKNVTLTLGPQLEFGGAGQYDFIGDSLIELATYSPRGLARVNINYSRYSTIAPQVLIGYSFVSDFDNNLLTGIPDLANSQNGFFNARLQINVRQRYWGVIGGYFYGPSNIFLQSSFIQGNDFNRSIQIRPYFNKFIYRDKIQLTSYSSYLYNTSTDIENITLNAQFNFFMGKGWILRTVSNLFFFNFSDPELGSVNQRTYAMHLGFTKRFDFDQPRVHYHDLRVVFFRDQNGNRVLDDNEQLIDNILADISRVENDSVGDQLGTFVEKELISNQVGEIVYENIPDGVYNMNIVPLHNLRDLYNINGNQQQIPIYDDVTWYVPFAQSYKVVGKVSVERDEFTTSGLVSVADIRVTVTDPEGRQFSSLTDPSGNFVVYVPQNPGFHSVTVANVLGEKFFLEQNEFMVNFNGYSIFEVNFKFMERKRKIKFNNGGPGNFFRNGPINPGNPGQGGTNSGNNSGGTNIPQPERPNVPAGNAPTGGGATGGTTGNNGGGFQGNNGGANQGNQAGFQGQNGGGVSAPNGNAGTAGGGQAPSVLPPNDDFARNLFKEVDIDESLGGDELRQQLNRELTPNAPDNETRPIDKSRVGFRVMIGIFEESIPNALLSNLVTMGVNNEGVTREDGSTQFVSESFKTPAEAEAYQGRLQSEGYTGTEVVGDYNGITITREQAENFLNQ